MLVDSVHLYTTKGSKDTTPTLVLSIIVVLITTY